MNDHDSTCLEWLLSQLDEGNTDSGLPTRFHYFLTERLRLELSFTETQAQFLSLCRQLNARARVIDGHFVYGIAAPGQDM